MQDGTNSNPCLSLQVFSIASLGALLGLRCKLNVQKLHIAKWPEQLSFVQREIIVSVLTENFRHVLICKSMKVKIV